jgi:hypothetical protein
MRLQKEEQIVVVLLFMALGSLAVAYWMYGPGASEGGVTSSGTASTTLEGEVLSISETRTGGNFIIKLDSTPYQVFVPASSNAIGLLKSIKKGERIRVSGDISEYQGKKEIEVGRFGSIDRA